jgi:hypothetical protein
VVEREVMRGGEKTLAAYPPGIKCATITAGLSRKRSRDDGRICIPSACIGGKWTQKR